MTACFHSPTFHQRLSSNFGIIYILSLVSLSLVISQKLKDSSKHQIQHRTGRSALDCSQFATENSEDLLQGDTSDEEAKIKAQTNINTDCINQQKQKQLQQSNLPANPRQKNSNNHELATSIEPIYFGRYPSTGDLDDKSRNFPNIYDVNKRNNPLTSSFYLLGSEFPQHQYEYQEKSKELSEPTSGDTLNKYSYKNSSSQQLPLDVPFVRVNSELDLPLSILKPFEKPPSTSSHRGNNKNSAKRLQHAIPLVELAQRQFELSGIYGIKQDDMGQYVTQKFEDKSVRSTQTTAKQSKPTNIQNKVISSNPQLDQQVRIPLNILEKIQAINAEGNKLVSSQKKKVPEKKKEEDKDTKTNSGKFLNDLYRSSILKRLRQRPGTGTIPANISNLLKPGEVLLTQKKSHDNRKQPTDNEVTAVKPRDIVGLLRKLKPLTVTEHEKPEAEKADHENLSIDEDFELEKAELEELKRQNRVQRVLPTAHLFGGSVGVVNETRIKGSDLKKDKNENETWNDHDSEDSDDDNEQGGEGDENQESRNSKAEDIKLLKVLTDLGSSIGKEPHSEHEIQPIDSEFYELYGNKKSENKREANYGGNKESDISETGSLSDGQKTIPPIAIEALVDHLMSSSRLATFGVQHTGVKVPKSNDVYEDHHEPPSKDEEEEEEDDEDENNDGDDDTDNNDTLPSVEEKEAESNLSETKILPSFDSVANMSDTWIPLDSIEVNNKQLLHNKNEEKVNASKLHNNGPNDKGSKSSSKKRKRRRKKKRREKKSDLVLIIGDKMLSRTDLIRLIRVLNKMSSKKEASREREASRRLLRFLVKLALEEYRKNKESNSNDNLNDPIREVLRSILTGPIYGKESEMKDGNLTSSSDIQLKPLLPTNIKDLSQTKYKGKALSEKKYKGKALEGNETTRSPLRKSLSDVTDDLDLYFESDFFEDLADKHDNSTKEAQPDHIKITKSKPHKSQHNKKKLKRASRAGYSLPVPIYGKQNIETVDEDDVELDHVRLVNRPSKRRSAPRRPPVKDNDDDDDDDEYEAPKRSRKQSREIKSKTLPDGIEQAEEPDPEPDEEHQSRPDEDRRKASNGNSIVRLNNPSQLRRNQKPNSAPANSRRARNRDKDNDDSGEPDPSSIITGEVDSDIESQDDPDSEPDKVPGSENLEVNMEPSNKMAPQRRRKRRQRKSGSTKRKLAREKEVNPDDRDEIPAPIAEHNEANAGNRSKLESNDSPERVSSKSHNSNKYRKMRRKSSNLMRDDENRHEQIDPSKGVKKKPIDARDQSKQTIKKKSVETINGKKLNKEDRPRKRNVRHKSVENKVPEAKRKLANSSNSDKIYLNSDEPASEEPEPNVDNNSTEQAGDAREPQDKDYYNEDTSYSKVCEDDGKCRVLVQSTSPKLSEAIRARDKPSIEQQLGNFVRND